MKNFIAFILAHFMFSVVALAQADQVQINNLGKVKLYCIGGKKLVELAKIGL